MRFGILGNSTFAERLVLGFTAAGHTCEVAASLPKSMLPNAAAGLADFAALSGIPYFDVMDANSDDFRAILDSIPIDFLVVSWPQMLRHRLITRFSVGVIGTHPTPLPWGRGRHPLHWLIAMAIPKTSLSFFVIDQGVDTGELIHQEIVVLEPADTIEDATEKLNQSGESGALRVGLDIADKGFLVSIPQPANPGSLWRKRTQDDVKIDCRMSGDAILRLVRSFSRPFPMAQLETLFGPIAIHKAELLHWDRDAWVMHTLGSVLEVSKDSLVVRVDDGVIRLHAAEKIIGLDVGHDLHPPSYYC